MLQPKEIEIECHDGTMKKFILHKFPAIAGREIVTQYPLSALPKLGEYKVNEEIMQKMIAFVGVPTEAGTLLLSTRVLIDNHVPDFECLMRLEAAMLEYNVSFFGNGKASTFFGTMSTTAQTWISQTLTVLLQQLSAKS